MHQLLWQLSEDAADEISELLRTEEIEAWLDDQSALTTDQELAARGFSVRTH